MLLHIPGSMSSRDLLRRHGLSDSRRLPFLRANLVHEANGSQGPQYTPLLRFSLLHVFGIYRGWNPYLPINNSSPLEMDASSSEEIGPS